MPKIATWPYFKETRPIGEDDIVSRPPRLGNMLKVQVAYEL